MFNCQRESHLVHCAIISFVSNKAVNAWIHAVTCPPNQKKDIRLNDQTTSPDNKKIAIRAATAHKGSDCGSKRVKVTGDGCYIVGNGGPNAAKRTGANSVSGLLASGDRSREAWARANETSPRQCKLIAGRSW